MRLSGEYHGKQNIRQKIKKHLRHAHLKELFCKKIVDQTRKILDQHPLHASQNLSIVFLVL